MVHVHILIFVQSDLHRCPLYVLVALYAMMDVTTFKAEIKNWEHNFHACNGRIATIEDIKALPLIGVSLRMLQADVLLCPSWNSPHCCGEGSMDLHFQLKFLAALKTTAWMSISMRTHVFWEENKELSREAQMIAKMRNIYSSCDAVIVP